jgi:hypothetical protein
MPTYLEFDDAWVKDYCKRTGQANPLETGANQAKPVEPKRRKYGNNPTDRDGLHFDSKHEADRYAELMLMVKAGEILGVICQHPFLLPGGVVYRADFLVIEKGGTWRVEDAKSVATARDKVYRLKKRLMWECLGIEIREV